MAHIKKQDLPPKHSHSQEEVIQLSQQRPRRSLQGPSPKGFTGRAKSRNIGRSDR
jgi:hypothetical protein